MSEYDEWDSLTAKQQKARLAKIRKGQRLVQRHIKQQMAEMAAFVRANPDAVIEATGDMALRAGEIGRYVLHIEVDAGRFERFRSERK